ncbi:zinc ABC transporter substrate-binding protein [Peptoniphilus equinus]|uniref:Zinc ABC transporter substrate-binding protein n=1 Tax=Peptoniphilus equinus TaxID=3016343 RepID=A0ABY7QRE1_9FIRM|nr:zinc ABC transporter substrate-binding protein [Peptoniphilus equinus]WBW49357.1 zinc ABC transporter substrate-binding protein [Peptoniphilus equinus]
MILRKICRVTVLSVMALIALTGCSGTPRSEKEKPVVYASFYPIYDLVRQIAGDTVTVKSFMPTDGDPHMWEPTAKNLNALAQGDLLFLNGANLERWSAQVTANLPELPVVNLSNKVELISYKGAAELGDFQYMAKFRGERGVTYKFEFGHTHEDVMRVSFFQSDDDHLEQLIEVGKNFMQAKGELIAQKATIEVKPGAVYTLEMGHQSGRVFFELPTSGDWYVVCDRVSEMILPYTLMQGDESLDVTTLLEGSTSGQDKVTYDPHSWLSITNAKAYVVEITRALSEMYPEYEKVYKKNSVKALDKLTQLHAYYREKFNALPADRREFVVTHYAWEYLAQEFGLKQYPLQGLISTESPSLKTIKKAIGYCEENHIHTIFYEDTMPPKSAATLAEEIHGRIEPLTSMEYITDAGRRDVGSYTVIMEENLQKLYTSLTEVNNVQH